MAKDIVTKAVTKTEAATSLFTTVVKELDEANTLLAASVEADKAEIARLQNRVAFSETALQANNKVINNVLNLVL